MERGAGIRRGWYAVALILAAGLAGGGLALGGVYHEVVLSSAFGFFRVNRFTGSVMYCRAYTEKQPNGDMVLAGVVCHTPSR